MGATIYGILNFGDDKKIQSIRHVITPSISFSNTPSFKKYYDTYIIDAEGNTAEYTRFTGSLNGIPSKSFSNSMGISIGNTFEAKIKDKDSTATELKKMSYDGRIPNVPWREQDIKTVSYTHLTLPTKRIV